jgi:hypothetical protein
MLQYGALLALVLLHDNNPGGFQESCTPSFLGSILETKNLVHLLEVNSRIIVMIASWSLDARENTAEVSGRAKADPSLWIFSFNGGRIQITGRKTMYKRMRMTKYTPISMARWYPVFFSCIQS